MKENKAIFIRPHLKDLGEIPYFGLTNVSERLIGITASINVSNDQCEVVIESNDDERMGIAVLKSAFVCNFSAALSNFAKITIRFSGIEFAIPNTLEEDGKYEGMFYKDNANLAFSGNEKPEIAFEFEDCEFNSQYKVPWISTKGLSSLSIKNCTFEDNCMGIYANEEKDELSKTSICVSHTKFSNVYYPIVIDKAARLTIVGCIFDLPNGSRGIKIQNCTEALINSCVINSSMVTNDKYSPKSCFLHIIDPNTRCSISNIKKGSFNGVVCAIDYKMYGNVANIKSLDGPMDVFFVKSTDEPWSLCEKSFLNTKRHCKVNIEDEEETILDPSEMMEEEAFSESLQEEDYDRFLQTLESLPCKKTDKAC